MLSDDQLVELREHINREMVRREHKALIRAVPILAALEDDVLDRIADGVELVEFSRGDRIVVEGGDDEQLYIVISGRAAVTTQASGGDGGDPLHFFEAGAHFGEQALLHGERRSATITAAADRVGCLQLGKELYQEVLADKLARRRLEEAQVDAAGRRRTTQPTADGSPADRRQQQQHGEGGAAAGLGDGQSTSKIRAVVAGGRIAHTAIDSGGRIAHTAMDLGGSAARELGGSAARAGRATAGELRILPASKKLDPSVAAIWDELDAV